MVAHLELEPEPVGVDVDIEVRLENIGDGSQESGHHRTPDLPENLDLLSLEFWGEYPMPIEWDSVPANTPSVPLTSFSLSRLIAASWQSEIVGKSPEEIKAIYEKYGYNGDPYNPKMTMPIEEMDEILKKNGMNRAPMSTNSADNRENSDKGASIV